MIYGENNINLSEKAEPARTTRYQWNSDNRLIKVERGSQSIEYGYDPQGRRIKRLARDGSTRSETHYLLDAERPYHEIVTERTQENSGPWNIRTYLYTPDGAGTLISDSDGTTTRQIYSDGQGSTRLITAGATTHTYSFDAFGTPTHGTAHASHLYSGEHYDPDTGLIHLRARDYDPRTGRFISMDEHPGDRRIPLTLNKYLYGNADPVNYGDPSGYMFVSMAMPNYGHLLRAVSAGRQAMGILDKLDKALMLLQLRSVFNNVWGALDSKTWRDLVSQIDALDQSKDGGADFLNALSSFDLAVADLARNSHIIFSDKGVQRQIKSFIAPNNSRFKMVIYAPTPMKGVWISNAAPIRVGSISLSKFSRDVVLNVNKVSSQGGRMLGLGHISSRTSHTPWFRQDWHSNHNTGDIDSPPYHYHLAK